ncbi:MAG: EamA family transporter [Spirochaetes bacterium]|jgi:multidrug transporter EmrE-like cation transporter|nr:EamA family transporter [Spirochaetota bacterium]
MSYLYILGTILFTVLGQLIIKWRMNRFNTLPDDLLGKGVFLLKLIFDPFIFSGLLCAGIAWLLWMGAMTKFELSYAYPFAGLTFILILVFSVILFNEPLTIHKIIGTILIAIGLIISSRSL